MQVTFIEMESQTYLVYIKRKGYLMNDLVFQKDQIFHIILGGFAILLDNSKGPLSARSIAKYANRSICTHGRQPATATVSEILSAECLWTYYV